MRPHSLRFGGLKALARLSAIVGLSIGMGASALAAEPTPTDEPGKPLQGKGFSIDDLENSLWSPQKRASELAKSETRKRKIDSLLQLVADPQYPDKAEALFRLAETHWQEAKFQYFMEREKYNTAVTCFEEKRCTEEPKEPIEDQKVALDYYRQVLQANPNYPRLDQVTYFLGRASIESGKAKQDRQLQLDGEKYLQEVIKKYPTSPLVPEAHLTLAEYYFEKDSLYFAKSNYEAITTKFKSHSMFNYALYKLGWVYFNLAEFDKTIETFHSVIKAIKGNEKDGLIEFREQALNDLIQAYAEVDNGWRLARDYFMKEIGEAETYEKLDKMAALLISKDRDEDAIALYKHLVEHDKTSPKVAEYYSALMEVRKKLADMRETEAEINELVAVFDTKGAWTNKNKGNSEAMEKADGLVASSLAWISSTYHKQAQDTEEKGKGDAKKKAIASTEYDAASKYYAQFLDRFPNHPDAYKFNFFYAEILFDREKFLEASEQYEKTLLKDSKGEYVEDAALGVVFSMERELCRTGKRKCAADNKELQIEKIEVDATLKRGEAEEEEKAPSELDPLEKRMVGAADRYVEVLSAALKDPEFKKKYPNRGEKIPNMMYVAAEIFHQHAQYKEAVTRLQVIFDLFPKDEIAGYAVNLIIDAYKRLKNWVQIEKWAREVIQKKNFTTKKKEDWELIIAQAKTAHAKDLTEQRRYDEAIKVQQEIVTEFSKEKKLASTALYNIAVIHEAARRFPEAVRAYEDLIVRYDDTDMAVRAQAAIGFLYESQTEFAKAAEAFVKMQKFKGTKDKDIEEQAAVGFRNAGYLYQALENYQKAYEVFNDYTKIYASRPDASLIAMAAGRALEKLATPEGHKAAGAHYEKVARNYGRKDKYIEVQALASAAVAYKNADKVKNRKKVEGLIRAATKAWEVADKAGVPSDATQRNKYEEAKYLAALSTFEQAEYYYDDYAALKVEALSKSGAFDIPLLKRTLVAKAEALRTAEKAFDKVLDFKDKGMAAAAAFRLGQVLYEFSESLANAPPPPGLTEDQVDEYRFTLEELYAPIQERALAAFTAALRQAVKDNVYNKWSRLSAVYAAKVNKDEFPIAEFTVQPDKTSDTVQSTSFIKAVRRGSEVVDYYKNESIDKDKKDDGKPQEGEPKAPETGKENK